MPHQCTSCGRTFDDGSKEMLSGCPDCGGNKFQFRPGDTDGASSDEPEPEPPDPPERPGDAVSRTVGSAAATVRDFVGGSSGGSSSASTPPESEDGSSGEDSDIIEAECEPVESEDSAQADARSTVVEPGDIPPFNSGDDGSERSPNAQSERADRSARTDQTGAEDATAEAPEHAGVDGTGSSDRDAQSGAAADADAGRDDRPDLAELREELNDQFESIRVLAPGQYELNLMELYDREEYIIALQEDGRYSIRVPETIGEVDA